MEDLVEFEYLRFKDGPDVPVVENPHYFALIRFLGLINNTNMAIDWTFEDVQMVFDSKELTEYSRNLHLKLLGFLGKRFPPHVTLERNLSKFLDERPIDVSVIFWDKVGSARSESVSDSVSKKEDEAEGTDALHTDTEAVKTQELGEMQEDDGSQEFQLYNPYRDNEYRNVESYERLRTIRILINSCIQESKQLRNILQKMEGYSMKCKNVRPGDCFFGLSPPFIGTDDQGYHYWYINPPNDEVVFKLYREASLTGELTLLSDNSDTLCSTFKTFLNSESLKEIGQKLEAKYNTLVVAEKAKLRKIRQMRSIRNQLESSWGNCAPTDEMLSGGRVKRKAAMNVDYSYSRSESGTRRSSRITRNSYVDSDSSGYDYGQTTNQIVRNRGDRLAMRNAKKQQIEEIERENIPQDEIPYNEDLIISEDRYTQENKQQSPTPKSSMETSEPRCHGDSGAQTQNTHASNQTPVLPFAQQSNSETNKIPELPTSPKTPLSTTQLGSGQTNPAGGNFYSDPLNSPKPPPTFDAPTSPLNNHFSPITLSSSECAPSCQNACLPHNGNSQSSTLIPDAPPCV
ncbi:apicomplexan conserved protein [Cryptosporidium felis]|nr:apicomplexan conserved protein [Cryptosporidium felis]